MGTRKPQMPPWPVRTRDPPTPLHGIREARLGEKSMATIHTTQPRLAVHMSRHDSQCTCPGLRCVLSPILEDHGELTQAAVDTSCSIHRLQYTPAAVYTGCSIHRLQYTPAAVYTGCSIHRRLAALWQQTRAMCCRSAHVQISLMESMPCSASTKTRLRTRGLPVAQYRHASAS
jgi:hypothetical protein